jgi:hypothetical protein
MVPFCMTLRKDNNDHRTTVAFCVTAECRWKNVGTRHGRQYRRATRRGSRSVKSLHTALRGTAVENSRHFACAYGNLFDFYIEK